MIEIIVEHDSAEAETPEDAVYAARILCSENERYRRQGFNPTIVFRVDGKHVATTDYKRIWRI